MTSLARERIQRLLKKAEEKARKGEEYERLVEVAFEIGESHNISVPGEFRRKICDSCRSFLLPGRNARVRLRSEKGNIVYLCENCGEVNRHGYQA